MSYLGNDFYDWMYYPPPYAFLSPECPPGVSPQDATSWNHPAGLSGCGCGGKCGHCGGGLGLFDSGMDYTQWGLGEWAAVAVGFYFAASIIGDVGRAKKRVGRVMRRRTSRQTV